MPDDYGVLVKRANGCGVITVIVTVVVVCDCCFRFCLKIPSCRFDRTFLQLNPSEISGVVRTIVDVVVVFVRVVVGCIVTATAIAAVVAAGCKVVGAGTLSLIVSGAGLLLQMY